MTDAGGAVFRRGWPDFFVIPKEDDVFVVEVKGRGDSVRPSQAILLNLLAQHGIDAYIVHVHDGEIDFVDTIGDSKPWGERVG